MSVVPFRIAVPEDVLVDLRLRLGRMRLADEPYGAGWDYGTNAAYLAELATYWAERFDWRAAEARLNGFAQYRADVSDDDGARFGVHFVHERGRGPDPMPLVLSHGWPSSFAEMLRLVPLLTDPAAHGGDAHDSFDVVVPSMPGFGFSDRPTERGMTLGRSARLWANLMNEELGYAKYGAFGEDWGAMVTQQLARTQPERVLGIHLTYLGFPDPSIDRKTLTMAEEKYLAAVQKWMQAEGAYAMLQSTRPQSLAHALNDSPVGLLSWLLEKFRAWSDCGGEVERRWSKDELLTQVTIYWATQTIASSMRTYYENMHEPRSKAVPGRLEVPTAVALFPSERQPPREWAERTMRIERWTKMRSGGHFAAWEEPQLLAEDLRAFFRPLRRLL